MSTTGRVSGKSNTFCIQYWKVGDAANPKVMRRINADGMVISAKKYDEVFFYNRMEHAIDDMRWFYDNGFDGKIKKCCKGRNGNFWLI
ncbi:hypothetical protein Np050604_226 [Cyanophage S-RIM44]|uniref:Uncharacterized protein n=2 Tax=Vellamovirus TaxID=2733139 RepID=A0A127KN82_9CAUD|nr:hypothetical protein Syn1_230 [Prochlorococcus phage Syn1]AMO43465.1 hypothetical protein W270710_226 [Cyanophage S-RIM44]ADO99326.1 hypothetical protein Syn1_230 [Prochlorococcus phage Syn1]AOO11937.1 hypothetical protein Np050604_226 [Cyanophage S-RIM44]AOO12638.1 hypothetical protein Sn080709_226 [Cyanophage S-RIM44]AOO13104.1 hypothetical protein W2100709_227 [Cyanophage S-RIM44]